MTSGSLWHVSREMTWLQPGRDMMWLKPGLGVEDSVLMAGTKAAGKLLMSGDRRAIAETISGTWLFRVEKLWNREYVVCREPDGAQTARFFPRYHWTTGTFSLGDGTTFHWKLRSILRGEFEITDAENSVIVRISLWQADVSHNLSNSVHGDVELSPGTHSPQTISLIVTFAWYLILLQMDHPASIGEAQIDQEPLALPRATGTDSANP